MNEMEHTALSKHGSLHGGLLNEPQVLLYLYLGNGDKQYSVNFVVKTCVNSEW